MREVVDHVVLAGGYDAMCVFDADNLVHPDFLARMNDAVCAGHVAVQGFRDSKNPEQSAISGCYSICYWMLNRFYNSARSALGLFGPCERQRLYRPRRAFCASWAAGTP